MIKNVSDDDLQPCKILSALENANIKVILLNNFTGDFGESYAKDIDFFVEPLHWEDFTRVITEMGFFERRKPARHEHHRFFINITGDASLALDVRTQLKFTDRDGIAWRPKFHYEIEKNLIKDDSGVIRPSGFHCFLLYCAHCGFLERRRIERRHVESIKRYSQKFWGEFLDNEKLFVDNVLSKIEDEDIDLVPRIIQTMIEPYFERCENEKILKKGKMESEFGSGGVVYFLGPDGVGKSTLVAQVKKDLQLKTADGYFGLGKDGWRLKIARELERRRKRSKLANMLFWSVVFPLELHIRKRRIQKGGRFRIHLIDRVPGVPFMKGGGKCWLYKSILLPADLVVILVGDPEIIASRKPEETNTERARRDIEKWREVAEKLQPSRIVEVDTTIQDIEACSSAVVAAIVRDKRIINRVLKVPNPTEKHR